MNDSVTHPDTLTSHEAPAVSPAPSPQTGASAPGAATGPPAGGSRRRRLLILALVVIVCGVGYGAYWFLDARYYESTDDSYVNGDVVQITSEVPGTVIGLHADDTQSVARGQALLELDPADAQIAVRDAEANLARAVRTVRTLFAQADEFRAEIVDRQVALSQAEQDHQRRTALLNEGAVSKEEFQHTGDSIAELRATLASAREQLNATTAQIDGTTVATNPQVLAAAAALRNASLALRRTRIEAPVGGVVSRRSVQVGQRVAAGTPLMGVVPLDAVWVDANFKEVQLRDMRVGQPVTLTADIYGGRATYHGKLVGLSAGSGTAFALLPSQNASGNWIKIVQRLPVRVALDPAELRAHPLRIGLSVSATVNIRDTSGSLVALQVRRVPIPSWPSLADDTSAVDARIDQIIQSNLGDKRSAARLTVSEGLVRR
jgi:membrane fusion protein (multidrug efflux system)